MITPKIEQNAHKITYLIQQFPEKTLTEIISMLEMPGCNINTGIWAAQELGFISEPDAETQEVKLLSVPDAFNFGPEVEELEQMLVYSFETLAKKEADLEEHYLSNWTEGHPNHNVEIAKKSLLNSDVLAEYAVEDGENTYVFLTLFANKDKLWGKKQFQTDPLPDHKAPEETTEAPADKPTKEEPKQEDK